MGYTHFTVERIEFILAQHEPKKVLDLGAQNMYNQPILPAPYAKDWYENRGMEYYAIDISGENGSLSFDLAYPITSTNGNLFVDFIANCGTSEHIGIDGKFSLTAIYNVTKTMFDLVKEGGIIYNENPKTGNWPKHGFNYYTQEFYFNLAAVSDLEILGMGEHAACNNYVDGWNVWCILKKTGAHFPTLEEFSLLGIKES